MGSHESDPHDGHTLWNLPPVLHSGEHSGEPAARPRLALAFGSVVLILLALTAVVVTVGLVGRHVHHVPALVVHTSAQAVPDPSPADRPRPVVTVTRTVSGPRVTVPGPTVYRTLRPRTRPAATRTVYRTVTAVPSGGAP